MRVTIFIVFCLVAGFSVNAQDLLITIKGDTLNCKITKEDRDYVYFSFKKEGDVRNTLLEKRQIEVMRKGYFEESEVLLEEIENESSKTYHPLKIGFSGGWGYRTSKIIAENAEMENYLKGIRSGFQFGVDMDYYFTNYMGVGIKYTLFRASASGTVQGGTMEDRTTIHFAGPTYTTRFMSASQKDAFTMNLSLGYLGYFDSGAVKGVPVEITASTVGVVYDLGYEVGLSSHVALLFQASFLSGSFTKMKVTTLGGFTENVTLPDEQRESMNRLDLSVGLRFNWGNSSKKVPDNTIVLN